MNNLRQPVFNCSFNSSTHAKSKIFENHCHTAYELILVVEGAIEVITESRKFTVTASSAVVLSPFTYHTVFTAEAGKYERITVSFSANDLPDCIVGDFTSAVKNSPIVSGAKIQQIGASLKEALTAQNKQALTPLVNALITQLLYAITYSESSYAGAQSDEMDQTLAKIISFIGDNIDKMIAIDDIASKFFLSKSTVCHLFKSKMKISVKQYVLQKKISKATAMLMQGATAGEVSKALGYQNYANFYSAYKKITGNSPAEVKPKRKEENQ